MQPVFINGAATSFTWADVRYSLTDLIYECVQKALADAGCAVADIDAVVLAAHDLVDGRGLTNMVAAPAAATYLKDETRIGDDAAAAFILGDARVRTGAIRTCLVATWGRASEGPVDRIANALFDPFTTKPLGMTEVAVSGLRATSALATYPSYGEHRDRAARNRPSSADANRIPGPAWPLRDQELPLWADVVAAAVISADPSPVEVTGVGMSTEPFDVGDRDLLGLPALRQASSQALRAAHVQAGSVDVFELDGLTLFDDALAAEAVGAAGPGEGMRVLADGGRVNISGGSAGGYCAPAMGLVRIIDAYQRLLTEGSALALATGSSVVASQNQAAVVLSHRISRPTPNQATGDLG